jgi:hypothetical protein
MARLTATAVARLVAGLVSCCCRIWGLGPAGLGDGEPAVVTLLGVGLSDQTQEEEQHSSDSH